MFVKIDRSKERERERETQNTFWSALGRLTLETIEKGEKALLPIRDSLLKEDKSSLFELSNTFYGILSWNSSRREVIDNMEKLQEIVDILQIMKDMSTIQEGAGDKLKMNFFSFSFSFLFFSFFLSFPLFLFLFWLFLIFFGYWYWMFWYLIQEGCQVDHQLITITIHCVVILMILGKKVKNLLLFRIFLLLYQKIIKYFHFAFDPNLSLHYTQAAECGCVYLYIVMVRVWM